MLTEESISKLEQERIVGNRAKSAYDNFIKEFVELRRENLFIAFRTLSVEDTDRLMEIKRMLMAVDALEQDILNVIDTGSLASTQLDGINKETH